MSAFKKLRSVVAAVSAFLVFFLVFGALPANAGTISPPLSSVPSSKSPAAVLPSAENVQPLTSTAVFADVPDGTQFFTEISWLASQSISTGWTQPDGSRIYGPLLPVNRDAMAAFMYRLAGSPDFTAPATSPFTDVPPGTQFYKEITWLASQGISTGWTEANGTKTYRPLNTVNRDAMAAFMYRFAGSPAYTAQGVSFADVGSDNPFYTQITWLAAQGISTGWTEANGTKTYRPLNSVNRDAMAAFMYRFYRVTHPLTITDGTLHDGIAGARYLETVTATGGIEPLSWTATGLPVGLTFGADGTISGVPMNTGTSNVTFTVTDAAGSTATVTRTLAIPDKLPDTCVGQACAIVTPAANTVQVPAAAITTVTRDTTSQSITAVTLSGPTVNGTTIAAGQILVLAPAPQIESGATVRVNSAAANPDGTVTALVAQATPADAYTEGTVNSMDPTIDQQSPASPNMAPNNVGVSCSPGMTNTLNGLAVTPNLTPAMAAKWGWGGLSRFQFDLDGSVTVNLGIKVSGKGTCSLSFGEFKRFVPAGYTGAIVLVATPKVSIEFTGSTDMNATFTFKCGAEYVWTASHETRTSRCSTAGTQVKSSTDLDVEAKLSAGVDLRVSWNDIAGITGKLDYGVDTVLTPARNPGATVYLGASYNLGLCAACMWPGMPLNLTVFNGEIPIPHTYAKYVFPGPLVPPTPPATLAVTQTWLPTGTAGQAYRATLQSSGGVGPYSWGLSSGSMPDGLVLESSTGSITGIPTAAGVNNIAVVVHDSKGASASQALTLTVAPPPSQNALVNVKQTVGGYDNAYALKKDGTVVAWGHNGNGEVGDGTTTPRSLPVPLTGLTGVIQLAASANNAYALKTDGTVWAWGSNNYGQVGDGTLQTRLTPVKVTGLPTVKALYAGSISAYALGTDGRLYAWGSNSSGELGDGTTTNRPQPVVVPINDVKSVAVGAYMSAYALKNDGTVWAWGLNSEGQLGNGSSAGGSYNPLPGQVKNLDTVASIAAGSASAYAAKQDGTVWAWGDNTVGRLGDGATTSHSLPVQVTGLTQAAYVTAGGYGDVFAIRNDGTVWGWGDNSFGEMFDPFTSPGPNYPASGGTRLVPGPVSALTGFTSVNAAGYGSSYLVKPDGSAWSWGHNEIGQLGDGTTTDRYSLIPIGVQGG